MSDVPIDCCLPGSQHCYNLLRGEEDHRVNNRRLCYDQCSRIRILCYFFQISKKHDFLRFFWNDVSKSRKKSL